MTLVLNKDGTDFVEFKDSKFGTICTLSIVLLFLYFGFSLFGRLILAIFNHKSVSMFYDFIFGVGIITTIAFIIAVIQELNGR